jgi:hypothetical protein
MVFNFQLFLLTVSTCLTLCVEKSDAKPQFPSFPANPSIPHRTFPPRLIANKIKPTNHVNNKVSGSPSQPQPVLNANKIELTDRAKLLILRGNSPRIIRFDDLRPAFEDERPGVVDQQQVDLVKDQKINQQQLSGKLMDQVSGNKNLLSLTQLTQQNTEQHFPSFQGNFLKIVHPDKLLNQLSLDQKHTFLNQFELLTQDQQIYAYNKFLSTPQEVQQFAINQFLSLDSHILAAALQDEIRREE